MHATLERTIERLERVATWRTGVVALVGVMLADMAMSSVVIDGIAARRPEALRDGFPVLIDLAPLSSAAEVYQIYDRYSPDILGLVRLLYALDFVIPLLFALGLVVLIGKLLRVLGPARGAWRLALLVPFASLALDYAENAGSLFLLGQYQRGQLYPGLARATSVVTAGKFVAVVATAVTLLALLIRVVTRLARRARARP